MIRESRAGAKTQHSQKNQNKRIKFYKKSLPERLPPKEARQKNTLLTRYRGWGTDGLEAGCLGTTGNAGSERKGTILAEGTTSWLRDVFSSLLLNIKGEKKKKKESKLKLGDCTHTLSFQLKKHQKLWQHPATVPTWSQGEVLGSNFPLPREEGVSSPPQPP